jgi:excisionase family DNA binding protein
VTEEQAELLSIQEAADLLKVDPQTVRLWLKEGELEGVKRGTVWRVTMEAIEAFLAAHTPPTV